LPTGRARTGLARRLIAIDEELDKRLIAAMGATEGTGLEFKLIDYIPCYRSEAGTGNAMAFALWS